MPKERKKPNFDEWCLSVLVIDLVLYQDWSRTTNKSTAGAMNLSICNGRDEQRLWGIRPPGWCSHTLRELPPLLAGAHSPALLQHWAWFGNVCVRLAWFVRFRFCRFILFCPCPIRGTILMRPPGDTNLGWLMTGFVPTWGLANYPSLDSLLTVTNLL